MSSQGSYRCTARCVPKGIKPPPGYKTSISICRKFLSEHAPKKTDGETPGKLESKPVSPAQLLYATKIALGKGLVIPDEANASSAAMSAWIDSNRDSQSAARTKRPRRRKAGADAAPSTPDQPVAGHATADSLWQQGRRDEAWRPVRPGGMVCPAWS